MEHRLVTVATGKFVAHSALLGCQDTLLCHCGVHVIVMCVNSLCIITACDAAWF